MYSVFYIILIYNIIVPSVSVGVELSSRDCLPAPLVLFLLLLHSNTSLLLPSSSLDEPRVVHNNTYSFGVSVRQNAILL